MTAGEQTLLLLSGHQVFDDPELTKPRSTFDRNVEVRLVQTFVHAYAVQLPDGSGGYIAKRSAEMTEIDRRMPTPTGRRAAPSDLLADITGNGHFPSDHVLIYEDRIEYVKPGVLWGRVHSIIRFEDISSVHVHKQFGAATLTISSAGGAIDLEKTSPQAAARGAELISQWRSKLKQRTSQEVPGSSIPDQIRELAQLRDSGILTDSEFQQKKTDLLRRM